MNHIQVKPHPTLDPRAWPLLKHPASGGLLDAAGNVPTDGRPWLYDGHTCRLLTEGAILRADDPAFAEKKASDQPRDGAEQDRSKPKLPIPPKDPTSPADKPAPTN